MVVMSLSLGSLNAIAEPAGKPDAVAASGPSAKEEAPAKQDASARPEPSENPGAAASASAIYRAISAREALKAGLPPELADAVMRVESAYRPGARGAAGEVGLMQVMPPTARMLGFQGTLDELAVPETNIRLGVRYLAEAWRLAEGDVCTAVMKYRAGHNERRFSVLSVGYCQQVRSHLASLGYRVTGVVPEPTFGFRSDVTRMGIAIGTQQAARRLASGRKIKSRVGWAGHDARMKALVARGRVSL